MKIHKIKDNNKFNAGVLMVDEDVVVYEPQSGEDLNIAVRNAILMSDDVKKPVKFWFNGVYLRVDRHMIPDEAEKEFLQIYGTQFKYNLHTRPKKPVTAQYDILMLLEGFDECLQQGHDAIEKWMDAYIPLAHHIEVIFTGHDEVLEKLERAGYIMSPSYTDYFPRPYDGVARDVLRNKRKVVQAYARPDDSLLSWKGFFERYNVNQHSLFGRLLNRSSQKP